MKNVIVFQDRFGEAHRIYQLDEKQTFYDSLTEPGKGFSVQTTIDYSNGFTFFDTVPDAELWLKERLHGVVDAAEADVFCPKCNRGYAARDKSEDEWVWVYNKTCACDHTFKVEGRQIILYKVITD